MRIDEARHHAGAAGVQHLFRRVAWEGGLWSGPDDPAVPDDHRGVGLNRTGHRQQPADAAHGQVHGSLAAATTGAAGSGPGTPDPPWRRPAVAATTPASTIAQPSSWAGDGRSSRTAEASRTDATGCSSRITEVRAAGHPRQRDRDQQPAEHLRGQRQQDQPPVRRPRRDQVEPAGDGAEQRADERADRGGIEQRPGHPSEVAGAVPQHEQEPGVRDGRPDPEQHAEPGVLAVGVRADHTRDEHHSHEHDRNRGDQPCARSLAQQPPGDEADDDHLQVAEHRGDARADGGDRVVPEHQVDREENPCAGGDPPLAGRPTTESAVLAQHQQAEHRKRVEAAERRCRRGLDVGEPDQGGRGRDARGPRGGGEDRPVRDGHRSPFAASQERDELRYCRRRHPSNAR